MKIFTFILCLIGGFASLSFAQDLPLYRIYRAQGEASDFTRMADDVLLAQVILFGELHNNAVNHYLQLQLSKKVLQADPELLFGAEMFESDNQLLLDEYLSGAITAQQLEAEGKMWNNFKTDYKPLLDLAKENQRPFIATNIPRRYASMVNRGGLESLEKLPAEAQRYIAPLPIMVDLELPGYKWMIETMGAHAPGGQSSNIAKAQAVKDATMAHFILENLTMETRLIHFHGTFHSNNFEGIYWYLKQANPDIAIMTIATVEQDNLDALDEANKGLADFIIVLPKDAPKSY
jgi:uncharacterized iron-regulated protein